MNIFRKNFKACILTLILTFYHLSSSCMENQKIASGSSNGIIRIWDIENGRCVRRLTKYQIFLGASVNAIATDPNGEYLVSGGENSTINIWNLESGECINTLVGHKWDIDSVAISPDGKLIVSVSCVAVKIWSILTGEELKNFDFHCTSIKFSPNGKYLAIGDSTYGNGTITILDCSTWEEIKTIFFENIGGISTLTFDESNKYLAFGTSKGRIGILSTDDWTILKILRKIETAIRTLDFDPNSRYLASESIIEPHRGKIVILSFQDWHILKILRYRKPMAFTFPSIAFSPDGTSLAFVENAKKIKIYETETWRRKKTLRHSAHVSSIAFLPKKTREPAREDENRELEMRNLPS